MILRSSLPFNPYESFRECFVVEMLMEILDFGVLD